MIIRDHEGNIARCPRHPVHFSRDCDDVRCLQFWEPPGAPTPEQQLARWLEGDAVCPNKDHECCPDLSCCKPKMMWPREKRERYMKASQGEREKMMMGVITELAASVGAKPYVTRGDPNDHR